MSIEYLRPGDELELRGETHRVEKQIPAGNYGAVYRTNCNGNKPKIVKVYGLSVPIGDESVGEFISNIHTYNSRLRTAGVRVPETLETIDRPGKRLGYRNVFVITDFVGESLENLIIAAKTKRKALRYVRMILNANGNLLNICEEGNLLVAVDHLPRNYTTLDGKTAIYVDIVPPKFKDGNKFLLEFPEVENPRARRVGIYRHYDAVGLMHALLVHLVRMRPEFYHSFEKEIINWLEKKGHTNTAESFRNRFVPTRISLNGNNDGVVKHIESLRFRHIYDMRELAGAFLHVGLMTPDEVNDFHKVSHFSVEPLADEVMDDLRQRLIQACHKKAKHPSTNTN
ncbi:MAG: hypothetical protein ABIE68_00080 [bacterium]